MAIAKGTARGLTYLHHMSIIHGNLTARNFLLDEQFHPKISEFGLSRLMTTTASVLAVGRELGYRAPELSSLMKPTRASTKSDVYSLGIIILELLTGELPSSMDLPKLMASVVGMETDVFDVELMRDEDAGASELVGTLKLALQCVDSSPSVRPQARDVLWNLEKVHPEPKNATRRPSEDPSPPSDYSVKVSDLTESLEIGLVVVSVSDSLHQVCAFHLFPRRDR